MTLLQKLAEMPRSSRILVSSLLIAVAATYLPLIPVNLFGHWINNWKMWSANGVLILVLMVVNAIAIRTKRIAMTYGVFGLILGSYITLLGIGSSYGFWAETWVAWLYSVWLFAVSVPAAFAVSNIE